MLALRVEPARGHEWAAGSFGLLGNQRRTRRGEGKGSSKLDINSYFLGFQKLLSLKIKEKISHFLENEKKTTGFNFLGHHLTFFPWWFYRRNLGEFSRKENILFLSFKGLKSNKIHQNAQKWEKKIPSADKEHSHARLWEYRLAWPVWKTLTLPMKAEHRSQQFNSWVYIHPEGMCPFLQQKSCTQVFIAVRLVVISKQNCPNVHQ